MTQEVSRRREEEDVDEAAEQPRAEHLGRAAVAAADETLAEIDKVLESNDQDVLTDLDLVLDGLNAEEFVASFVQRGGQ